MEFVEALNGDAKQRYATKLRLVGLDTLDTCPYQLDKIAWTENLQEWPPLEFPDIYLFLVDSPGTFTKEKLKAYKSMEAYNFFASGHVGPILHHTPHQSPYIVLKAGVLPSQRVTDKPHQPWVAVNKKNGVVLCGHCTCMAGLGEVCSHVAAILFKVEAAVRLGMTDNACTSVACKWNQTCVKKSISSSSLASNQYPSSTSSSRI